MTKFLFLLFCGFMSVAGCNQNLKPDDGNVCSTLIASGTTGTLTWVLYEDGTLTISGEGEMPDYYYDFVNEEIHNPAPWYDYQDNIVAVIIGDEVENIGREAFHFCFEMKTVYVGSSVTVIGREAFSICENLASVNIPNSVTYIDYAAFYGCTNLSSVSIGKSASIGGSTFRSCPNLNKIIVYQKIPQVIQVGTSSGGHGMHGWVYSSHPFIGVDRDNCTLLVPAGSEEAYRNAEVWNYFVNIKAIQ